MAVLFYMVGVIWAMFSGSPDDKPRNNRVLPYVQEVYNMVVKDTSLRVNNRTIQTFTVNGQLPPRILTLQVNAPVSMRFLNATPHELLLLLPRDLLTVPATGKWITLLPGQAFPVMLRTRKSGVYSYRINRPEQKDNGLTGAFVIK